ncbi:SKI/DACH domain-containing protein 1-like [Anguilla rostrata]|uniref:SKI/DACH domain-containing protein 1-like n=1 Tax=Anguilla rostrata TaxID=7938 RepID=UPI0030CD081E
MGDLESGFEEMDGVKLGYLVIKGKQMFALSQVFTDLLKNIPRTTVHKRMDHLNVKKHHCDLEELRKLKAINSIAFHAAKCTLISREDVEALYVSCKTERVLKSKRSKLKTKSSEYLYDEQICSDPSNSFWREKVWLSLHGVHQPLAFKNRTGRKLAESVSTPACNLPQIHSKCTSHGNHTSAKSACRISKNYETAQIPRNSFLFNPGHSIFRSVVCARQSSLYQSAIAVQSKLSSAADLTYKRKRQHENTGWHFWNTGRHSRRVLLVPKCCKSKLLNGSLNRFNLEQDLYIDHQHIGNFQESCSSDTESSSYSGRADNDSDFGSSLSATSNSGTSDEEDDSVSESSDVSSDEDSSSQSDSSSVSSQVSLQSIRFRRTSFSAFNSKAPLLTQPTFHYELQHRTQNQSGTPVLDYRVSNRKLQNCDLKLSVNEQVETGASRQRKPCPLILRSRSPESRREGIPQTALSHFGLLHDPKCTDPIINHIKGGGPLPCLQENKDSPKQRVPGQANKYPQPLISNCAHDKETGVSQSPDKNHSLGANFKKETSISHVYPHHCTIKTEREEKSTPPSCHSENATAAKTPPTLLHNVKIKVEENFEEYQHSSEIPGFGSEYQCNQADAQCLKGEDKPVYNLNYTNKATEDAENPATSRNSPERTQEFKSTLCTRCPEEGEYKNGAKVRKNYRTLVLGKQSGIPRTKADRTVHSTGKHEHCEGSPEDFTGTNKRKRATINVAAVKKPFKLMANFPSPPSLIIGSDGDLSPAYSLKSTNGEQSLFRSHPVWKWQLGGSAVPLPPSHRFRKF